MFGADAGRCPCRLVAPGVSRITSIPVHCFARGPGMKYEPTHVGCYGSMRDLASMPCSALAPVERARIGGRAAGFGARRQSAATTAFSHEDSQLEAQKPFGNFKAIGALAEMPEVGTISPCPETSSDETPPKIVLLCSDDRPDVDGMEGCCGIARTPKHPHRHGG